MVDSENNSFIFYQSFLSAIKCLPRENQLYAYQYITEYALQGIVPEQDEDPIAYAIFLMAKPQIDANIDRRKNGNKGGRPPKEKPMVSENEKEEKPLVIENEQNEKPNVNVNGNVNDNVSVDRGVGEDKRKGYGEFKKCFLSDSEYKKVIDDYGSKNGEMLINKVDNYCASKGKQYKNYVAAIRKFAEKDGIPKIPPKPPENETGIYDLPF